MNGKERLYAIIGGCVGAILTLVVCSFLPVGAQSQVDSFGDITCTGLKVVNANGEELIKLVDSDGGGSISIYDRGWLDSDVSQSKQIQLSCKKGASEIAIFSGTQRRISLGTDKYGGTIEVFPNKPLDQWQSFKRTAVKIGADKKGGTIDILSYRGLGKVSMKIDKYGGRVGVFDTDKHALRAAMGVNEYRNGFVSVWDKTGERLKR